MPSILPVFCVADRNENRRQSIGKECREQAIFLFFGISPSALSWALVPSKQHRTPGVMEIRKSSESGVLLEISEIDTTAPSSKNVVDGIGASLDAKVRVAARHG